MKRLAKLQSLAFSRNVAMVSAKQGRGTLFAFLDVPMSFNVNVGQLQKNYHELQSRVHPDKKNATSNSDLPSKAQSSPQQNGDLCELDSSYANSAYETLKSPFKRARYLLKHQVATERKGSPLTALEEELLHFAEDSKESLGEGDAPSEEFLQHMMECNEIVFAYVPSDGAHAVGRTTGMDGGVEKGGEPEEGTSREAFEAVEAEIKAMDSQFEADAAEAYAANDLKTFRTIVLYWTYVNNLKHHIHQRK